MGNVLKGSYSRTWPSELLPPPLVAHRCWGSALKHTGVQLQTPRVGDGWRLTGLQQAGESHSPTRRRRDWRGRCQGVREATVWAEGGSRKSRWKDLGSRLIYILPRIPQFGGWGVAQHLPLMHCSRFLSQHGKNRKGPASTHHVWAIQHLKGRPLHPSPFQAPGPVASPAPSDMQKNQVHSELLGTSPSLDCRPVRSQGRPCWGWGKGGVGLAPPTPPPPQHLSGPKLALQTCLPLFCLLFQKVNSAVLFSPTLLSHSCSVDTGDKRGSPAPQKVLDPCPCRAAQGGPLTRLS